MKAEEFMKSYNEILNGFAPGREMIMTIFFKNEEFEKFIDTEYLQKYNCSYSVKVKSVRLNEQYVLDFKTPENKLFEESAQNLDCIELIDSLNQEKKEVVLSKIENSPFFYDNINEIIKHHDVEYFKTKENDFGIKFTQDDEKFVFQFEKISENKYLSFVSLTFEDGEKEEFTGEMLYVDVDVEKYFGQELTHIEDVQVNKTLEKSDITK